VHQLPEVVYDDAAIGLAPVSKPSTSGISYSGEPQAKLKSRAHHHADMSLKGVDLGKRDIAGLIETQLGGSAYCVIKRAESALSTLAGSQKAVWKTR
jgi:hypothetical protein